MGGIRTWIFRVLVLAGAGLFLYSWFQPWWTAYIDELETTAINIHPWGVESFVPQEFAVWITGYEMPAFFAPLMWVYLGLCIAALLFSLFASSAKRVGVGKLGVSLPQALIGGVGLSYIGIVIIAVIVMLSRLEGFYNAPLIGTFIIDMGDPYMSAVNTNLLLGYWLACGVGPLLIILGLLRNKIIGR